MRGTWLVLSIGLMLATPGLSMSTPALTPPRRAGPPPVAAAPPAAADDDEAVPVESQSSPPAETPSAAQPTTFEALLQTAAPTADLGTLLAPLSGPCDGEKRELDRLRCRSMRAYLRRVIPLRSYSAIVDDPAVLAVSEFDAAIKGYHLSVAGCLACTRPVTVGRTLDRRLITLKTPAKDGESLRQAVEISRNSIGFDSLPEAKVWLEQSRPELRTEFVFKPGDTEWTFGANRGYAVTLLGFRVFNRCNGEILVSRPPSTGTAPVPLLDEGCRRREAAAEASAGKEPASTLPAQLSKNQISQAMNLIRPQVFACFDKFKVPGLAQFDYVVAGNGTVNSVRLSGAFFGTPTGGCLLDAAKDAHFPRFSRERQQFVYPFFLRQ